MYEGFAENKVTFLRSQKLEYHAANRFITTKETIASEKRNVSTLIQIGKSRYCREDSGEWKSAGCYSSPPTPIEDAEEVRYSLQNSSNNIVYLRIASFSSNQVGGWKTKSLVEDTLVLNLDMTIRERTIVRSAYDTKRISSRETEKFEYVVKLTPLEAPVK